MAVGDQDAVEALEANARLQNLALGAFATIHQETIFIVLDDGSGQIAMGGWSRGGGAEEDDFEQGAGFLSIR